MKTRTNAIIKTSEFDFLHTVGILCVCFAVIFSPSVLLKPSSKTSGILMVKQIAKHIEIRQQPI